MSAQQNEPTVARETEETVVLSGAKPAQTEPVAVSTASDSKTTAAVKTAIENQKLKKFSWREPIVTSILALLALLMGLTSFGYRSNFSFDGAPNWFKIAPWNFSTALLTVPTALIVLGICGYIWLLAKERKTVPSYLIGITLVAFIVCFLAWIMAGNKNSMPIVTLLAGGMTFSVPLVLGSLSGVVCERTGVINISIEGQLLAGAFLGVVVANLTGSAYLGLLGAALAGVLVAVLLALFTINFRTDHIIVGVVLNMLLLGLTNFIYSSLFVTKEYLNAPQTLPKLRIPILADLPIIGPVLFNQSILVYLMYAIVTILQIALFHSRWGLRSRACGEHPKAADTVGIKVNQRRWVNVLLGGAIAGLGGAFFTLGSGLAFIQNISAGQGFIALAAMILGAWNPLGAVMAAVLFGFTTQLGSLMGTVGSPVPAEYLLMVPYLITIFAVSGFVGKVRPPAMEGKPYPA